ncbi:MAG: nucleoside monophosphate kinase [bacterium]|nr:nucleoside monophosphate kinase [bacterium]
MSKSKLILNLILLGDPGAGKATQADYFAKKYNMFDFDMGRELTLLREKNAQVEAAQKRTADKGILTPTVIVRKINQDTIARVPRSKGILFDGHPKMVGEAKLIARLLKQENRINPLVLYIKIPVDEIINRTQNRKGYFNTKFSKRPDDSVSALRNRAKYYRKNIAEVVEFFKSKYTFAHIDGMGTKTEVRKRVQKAIDFYIKNYEQIYKTTGRN